MTKTLDFKPDELKHMKKEPTRLFYRGNKELLKKKKIGIVGSRRPISYTKNITAKLSSMLSQQDICIVSGAAMGIDAIAHVNAKPENTIAVMANGLDIKYPKVNHKLINEIEEKGLCLSSYEDGTKARAYSFVLRNELVVALSDILIITQADLKSGTMHSASYAKKQGKEIFVIPHRIGDSEGTNKLLEEKLAKPIYDVEKFIKTFGFIEKPCEDEFLEFCKTNPTYEEAISKYAEKVFEYELLGKVKIELGRVTNK